ncbi:MAG: DUF308 domain-containing protein [Lachnospiraceae bacterium]|nr:DUF308 domain-containing protein [Lachnospiraceae bacterium]
MKNRTGFGWLELALGVLMIFLGFFSLIRPRGAMTNMVFVYAFAAVITGVCDIVFYIQTDQYTGFGPLLSLVAGIISVMTGMMLLIYPGVGEWILYLLFPIWFIAHNIFSLASLKMLREAAGDFCYYFSLIASIAGLILGFLMAIHPFGSIRTVSIMMGFYLLLTGINCIVIALGDAGSGE